MGLFSAPRMWWTFRLFGKRDVAVLDGGLRKWMAEGREVEDLPPLPRDRHMTVQRQAHLVRDVTQVAQAAKLGDWQIVDARPADRFRGAAPEPRPGVQPGHVPGAQNLPWDHLVTPDGTLRDEAGLRAAFAAAGVDLERPIITMCGSGVTAAVISLALARLGHDRNALYDGSWSEWGQSPELGIARG